METPRFVPSFVLEVKQNRYGTETTVSNVIRTLRTEEFIVVNMLKMQIRNAYRQNTVLTTLSIVVICTMISYRISASVSYCQTVHSPTDVNADNLY